MRHSGARVLTDSRPRQAHQAASQGFGRGDLSYLAEHGILPCYVGFSQSQRSARCGVFALRPSPFTLPAPRLPLHASCSSLPASRFRFSARHVIIKIWFLCRQANEKKLTPGISLKDRYRRHRWITKIR